MPLNCFGSYNALKLRRTAFVHHVREIPKIRSYVANKAERLVGEYHDFHPGVGNHPHRSSETVDLLAEARLQTRLSAFDVLTPPNPEYHQLVSTICVPILLVIGDVPVVSIETARELQSLNPRVRVKQIQNAGHGVPYDQPERFAAVVRSFLRPVAAS